MSVWSIRCFIRQATCKSLLVSQCRQLHKERGVTRGTQSGFCMRQTHSDRKNIKMEKTTKPPSWFHHLLVDQSSTRYSLHYNGGLFNHMSHGIIALYRLGASENRINQFIEWYTKMRHLELPYSDEDKGGESPEDLTEWLGNRHQFYALNKHYSNLLDTKYTTVDSMIGAEFPKLQLGMAGAALHGLIQVGYGQAVGSKEIACEGIAYMHDSYAPLKLNHENKYDLKTLGLGKETILDVLEELREDHSLMDRVNETSKKLTYETTSVFGRMIRALFNMPCDDLMEYVYKIRFPDFFDEGNTSMDQAIKLGDWVIDCAIAVFAKSSRRSEFFLLHGVTAAWSLRQVLPLLRDYNMALHSLRSFILSLLAVYVSTSTPALNEDISPATPCDEQAWKEIIASSFREDRDEHVYKLVQVCQDRWQENPESGALYASACNEALSFPLVFEEIVKGNIVLSLIPN